MKHNIRRSAKVLFWTLGLAAATSMFVGCHGFHRKSPEERAEWIREKAKDKFDFNEQQLAKLDELSAEIVSMAKEHREKRKQDADAFLTALKANTVSAEEILRVYNERKASFDSRVPVIATKVSELSKTLNDEQRTELAEKLEKFREHMERH